MATNDFFLADDLSGVLDAAGAFHRAGARVRAILSPEGWAAVRPGEIAGLTTETRNATAGEAARVVLEAVAEGSGRGGRMLYKKIDSTLRGPVAAELEAMMQALPGRKVLFAPANPKVGRMVKDGVLLVNGVPVAETDFGRDPACPLRCSRVRDILGGAATGEVVIPDTLVTDDLIRAAERMDATGLPWVAVGSGALAEVAAVRVGRRPEDKEWEKPSVPGSPVLLLGGSAHPLNRRQAEELVRVQPLPVHEISFGAGSDDLSGLLRHLAAGPGIVVRLPSARTSPGAALSAIVAVATKLIGAGQVRRVFTTGGETAFALCRSLGVSSLQFLAEIEPGLSLSLGQMDGGAPLLLAVKPGGFGDAQTWIRAWTRLREY